MMEELLRRWSELEPERCLWGGDYISLDWCGTVSLVSLNSSRLNPMVQYAVQLACEERGWWWNLDYKVEYLSVVRGGVGSGIHKSFSDSPAEALLTAYLQALEEEQRWCQCGDGTDNADGVCDTCKTIGLGCNHEWEETGYVRIRNHANGTTTHTPLLTCLNCRDTKDGKPITF